MTRHLLKLVWNRKRTNALVALEIAVSFLVLFAVATLAVYSATNVRRPLGYTIADVYDVDVDLKLRGETYTEDKAKLLEAVHRAAAGLEGVEAVAGAQGVPYEIGGSYGGRKIAGREVRFHRDTATDDLARVLGIRLSAGRWFSREDDGNAWAPVVINERMAREAFGDADPIGKPLFAAEEKETEQRVVGVVPDYRKDGELSGPENFLFEREPVDGRVHSKSLPMMRPPTHLLVKVRAGTPPAFEETLSKALKAAAPDWSFEIQPLADARASSLRLRMAPLVAVGLIAAFLLAMVALGLIGVLWQNVTQRTREIGLRRAKGATQGAILKQILGELLVLTGFSLAVGLVIAVQVPLLRPFESVSTGVYASSLALSVVLMLILTSLCGLYPGWLAARVTPAEALRDE
jgi:putative ABC transport system permease protein